MHLFDVTGGGTRTRRQRRTRQRGRAGDLMITDWDNNRARW
ncbi:MAG TPA: hypothetical protein VGY50_06090 [Streptosporangiaceae bacterium]|nr:hypothetical protein [Streptosporangiaceae bacterium]